MIHKCTLQSLEFNRVTEVLASFCQSQSGAAMASGLLPFKTEEEVLEAQKLYEESSRWAGSPETLRLTGQPAAGGPGDFPDFSGLLNLVARKGAKAASYDTEAFWALRGALMTAKGLRDSICTPTGEKEWPRLMYLATNPPLPVQLTAALQRCINDDGNIRDESSPELYQVRVELRSLHQTCLRKVRSFAEDHNILPYLQDEFMTLSSDRYVLPFKATYKGRLQGIIHDWSQTGETCYFEPMFLVEINNKIQELKREERDREHEVLEFLAGLLDSELENTKAAFRFLTVLDFLRAKRLFAGDIGGRLVSLTAPESGISLVKARHPLLLLSELNGSRRNPNAKTGTDHLKEACQRVRPLDITLRPGECALIVTGGNAGGKTVCLKTLGLISAMTLAALPVPVEPSSHLPWFDRIDAFIGDEQSLDDNVSTFTAQIDHLAKAWKHFDSRSLVLLDEFGSGTDPAQGAALAQGVLDELINKHTFVLTATHFPALKGYALTREHARAASMLFNPDTHRPLYSLAYDQVGASQALDVAREHGLPESIIARAEHYLLQDGQDATALLHKLNDLAAQRAEELEHMKAAEQKAKDAAQRYRDRLEQDRLKLYEEVRGKAQELMKAWKEERITHRQALREMGSLRAGLAESGMAEPAERASILPKPETLHVNDMVMHTVFRKKGRVTEVDEKHKRVRLDLGGVGLWADMKDIREYAQAQEAAQKTAEAGRQAKVFGRITAPSAKKDPSGGDTEPSSAGQSAAHSAGASFSIDVRGLRAEAAIAEVQACIDKAYLAELPEVEIVHGRGTGALRRAIQDWLGTCSQVASYSTAPADRGGDGMTIAILK